MKLLMQPKIGKITFITLSATMLIIGGFIGYNLKPPTYISTDAIRRKTSYTFVRPLLAVGRPDNIPSIGYENVSKSVQKYIDTATSQKKISQASVFFINYGKSGSFEINDKIEYAPASLLKVVVMIAYLKTSESNPTILQKKLTYTKKLNEDVKLANYNVASTLTIGEAYKTEDLIRTMIIDSDNGATNLLLSGISADYINQVYTDLGIPHPNNDELYTISVKNYSLFLRILFNATYLSAENSEKALTILSKTAYKDGLVAGAPTGTSIAHKFGEHVDTDASGDAIGYQLHDCGIAYPAQGPLLLCVMTKGQNLSDLSGVIADITKVVTTAVETK